MGTGLIAKNGTDHTSQSAPFGNARRSTFNSSMAPASPSRNASTVTVCIRTRPTANFAQNALKVHDDKCTLEVHMPKSDNPNAQDKWSWRFDSVLHNASQETMYNEQVAPVVRSVLQGYNGAIMCYGQTGAGKTFTQLGSMDNYHNRGLIPRALADFFLYVQEHPQFEASISASYIEIHNDSLVDLLGSLPSEERQVWCKV